MKTIISHCAGRIISVSSHHIQSLTRHLYPLGISQWLYKFLFQLKSASISSATNSRVQLYPRLPHPFKVSAFFPTLQFPFLDLRPPPLPTCSLCPLKCIYGIVKNDGCKKTEDNNWEHPSNDVDDIDLWTR